VKYFYVDLDGTLKTDVSFSGNSEKYIAFNNKKYFYQIRPYAKEFIEGLKTIGTVLLLTLSTKRYAEYFLEKIGVTNIVDEVYSRENISKLPKLLSYVLIDNDAEVAVLKEKAILLAGGMFTKGETIVIPTYSGGEDGVLEKLLEEIKNKNEKIV